MLPTSYDREAKLWRGPDFLPRYDPKLSLGEALFSALTTFGSKIAQISDDTGIEMSYDEIRIKTIRAAQNLQQRGYQPKQVFGFLGENSHHVAPIVFASICIGCPISCLDPSYDRKKLTHLLKITEPMVMFCDIEAYALLKECLAELGNVAKLFTFGGRSEDSEPIENLFQETHCEESFAPVDVDAINDIATIFCTSGSTGLPKGVCASHATLLESMSNLLMGDSSDVMLCFSPLYWITGVWILIKGTLVGANRIITTKSFSPELQLRIMKQYNVSFIYSSTFHLIRMMKNDAFLRTDFPSMKYQLVGGDKLPLDLKIKMNRHLPNAKVYNDYGTSEIGLASNEYPESSDTRDTIGRIPSGICAKIIDEHGSRCGPNVDGEMCFKMRYKPIGYYNNPIATAELFDDEGFALTGDIGHFDEDGYLYMIDREKDLLTYIEYHISPSEIDAFLFKSPDIDAVCVVGIPDDERFDIPAAVVVRAQGSKIVENDVFDLVADNFPDYFKLRGGVYFVDELPTSNTGKVLRRKVKAMAIRLFNERNA